MSESKQQRRTYTAEFKREAVQLVTEQGDSLGEAARSLGVHPNLLRTWKQKQEAERDTASPGREVSLVEENRPPRRGTIGAVAVAVGPRQVASLGRRARRSELTGDGVIHVTAACLPKQRADERDLS